MKTRVINDPVIGLADPFHGLFYGEHFLIPSKS